MSNLWVLLVFVPPQYRTGPRLITVIYIFPLHCPRQNPLEAANKPRLKIIPTVSATLFHIVPHHEYENHQCDVLYYTVTCVCM